MNVQAHIIGPRGSGKTTIARGLVAQHMREGGWALVHDPMGQFRDMCATYPNTASWRARVVGAAKGKQPLHRGARFTCGSSEVVKLAVALGEKHNQAKNIRMPLMLVIDESAHHESSGGTWMSKEDNAMLSTARHMGVATVFNQQRLSQFPMQFYEMATDVYLFRMSGRRLPELEEALSIEPGSLSKVPTLFMPDPDVGPTAAAPAEFLHVKYAKGPV